MLDTATKAPSKPGGIRIIDVRHEQVAAHAADGYARQQATGNAMMAAQKAAT